MTRTYTVPVQGFGIVWVGLASNHKGPNSKKTRDLHSEPRIYTETSKILWVEGLTNSEKRVYLLTAWG